MIAISMPRFSMCRAGRSSGLPDTEPRSLRNATIEPVTVIAPMMTSM
jgi:hypothetical protein